MGTTLHGIIEAFIPGDEPLSVKQDRRGWVKARDGQALKRGTRVRVSGSRYAWSVPVDDLTYSSTIEHWCGCPNPLCTREEPHEIGIVECRMPKAPEMPGAHFEMTFADPSVPQVTKPEDVDALGMGGTVTEDALRAIAPDAIHTEAQLARALFVAMNEAEVVRRCELREAGENVRNLLTERCHAVVTTMMADPAYAKERDAAERLASRTWSARRVGLNQSTSTGGS